MYNVLRTVVNVACDVLQVEERDPDLAFREIAKFGILEIAGVFLY